MQRPGFTLVEVVLALALSVGLLAVLGLAIHLHAQRMAASHASIQQAQLVRGVLRIIAGDLQNIALGYQQDVSSAKLAVAASATFNVDEADSTTDQIEEEVEAETGSQRATVGLYGDAASLQVDVLNTQPEWALLGDSPLPQQRFRGGVAQVRYLLQADQAGAITLVRQQAPRDIALWQEHQGLTTAWDSSTRYIASEVRGIAFRYWDGEQYVSEWDMDESQGALPLAIEIELTVLDATRAVSTGTMAPENVRTYRVCIALPEGLTPTEPATADEGSTGSSATDGGTAL